MWASNTEVRGFAHLARGGRKPGGVAGGFALCSLTPPNPSLVLEFSLEGPESWDLALQMLSSELGLGLAVEGFTETVLVPTLSCPVSKE